MGFQYPAEQNAHEDAAWELMARLERCNPDGSRVYSETEVEHVLPALLLSTMEPGELSAAPDAAQVLIGKLALMAGIADGCEGKDALEKIHAFYIQYPPNPQLWVEVKEFIRDHASTGAARRLRAMGADAKATPRSLEPPKAVGVGLRKIMPNKIAARKPVDESQASATELDEENWR